MLGDLVLHALGAVGGRDLTEPALLDARDPSRWVFGHDRPHQAHEGPDEILVYRGCGDVFFVAVAVNDAAVEGDAVPAVANCPLGSRYM